MDAVISASLEEVCARGSAGIPLLDLWPALQVALSAAGLPLCDAVRSALWARLLSNPALFFEAPDGSRLEPQNELVISVGEAERLGVKIVAEEQLRDSFLGLYDVKAADSEFSEEKRRVLERLALARSNGITQNELAKEFGIKGNNIFYIVRGLEWQKLLVRQSTILKTKESGCGGASGEKGIQITNTNLIRLYRYGKNSKLGSQKRFEITRPDVLGSSCNADQNPLDENQAFGESLKEDVRIKDFEPAMKEICDKLEEANGKVLVVSDIKQALGYRMKEGHRAWRNILNRLKDAGLVEEFVAKINGKETNCVRLLAEFYSEGLEQKSTICGFDCSEHELSSKHGKRGQITDQLVELPLENLLYDMIDAAGPTGMTITEIFKRVGLNGKVLSARIGDMCVRFRLKMLPEIHKRTKLYRVWTSKSYQQPLNIFPNSCQDTPGRNESSPVKDLISHGQLTLSATAVVSCPNMDLSRTCDEQKMTSEASSICSINTDSWKTELGKDGQNPNHEIPRVNDDEGIGTAEKLTKTDVVPYEKTRSLLSLTPKLRTSQSSQSSALTVCNVEREHRILERLENEKFLLKAELHRWLEDLKKDKTTVMDRKTLGRTLNKLQQEGKCKCAQVLIPGISNCKQSRRRDVILHPSVDNLSKGLLDQIYEKQRMFDIQIRVRGSARSLNNQPVTELTGVNRLSVHSDAQLAKYGSSGAMLANGFVFSKMIRVKLLHNFFWSYLKSLPSAHNVFNTLNCQDDLKSSDSTCQLFALDAAVKAMPLELFLQVVGSAKEFDDLVKTCRLRMRLSDLPSQEYKQLMDTHATGRLSCIIDILLRLKLLRLVPKRTEVDGMHPHAVLTHAMELNPYIEETLWKAIPSSEASGTNLHPRHRHEFVLTKQEAVDAYWETLEYCYAAADPASAKHAFPGSSVPELFGSRSWASVRVMTIEQRSELLKRVAHDEPEKKIPFNECRKIARELNLTVEQVLRVTYDKCHFRLHRYSSRTKTKVGEYLTDENSFKPSSRKRTRGSRDGLLEHLCTDDGTSESTFPTMPILPVDKGQIKTTSCGIPSTTNNHDLHPGRSREDSSSAIAKESECHKEDTVDCGFIGVCAFSRLRPMRRKKFSWTDDSDRQLVMQYAKHRATLGVSVHRVDWASISDLPALPDTCRRRMALLKSDTNIRKAVMRVCNLLGERYTRYLKKTWTASKQDFPSNSGNKNSIQDIGMVQSLGEHELVSPENSSEPFLNECCGDNFEDPDVKSAIDEVLQYKKILKMEYSKRLGSKHEKEWADVPTTDGTKTTSTGQNTVSSSPGEAPENLVEGWSKNTNIVSPSGRNKSSHHHSHGRFLKLFGSRGIGITRQVCESLQIANAVELLKLVFLNTSAAPEVQASLLATLRLYSENDLFLAFNYLKMKDYMIIGHGSRPFVLSPKFWHSASSSPFPIDSGKRAAKFSSWLDERDDDLLVDGIELTSHVQCGEALQLFALVSAGKLCISPCLPKEGIGEADEPKNSKACIPRNGNVDERSLKRKSERMKLSDSERIKKHKPLAKKDADLCSRREKGFPGIGVLLNRATVSSVDLVHCPKYKGTCSMQYNEMSHVCSSSTAEPVSSSPWSNQSRYHSTTSSIQLSVPAKENILDAMTSYAKELSLKMNRTNNVFIISPEIFRCVLLPLYQAGEQGLEMEEISEAVDSHGMKLAEIVLSTLAVYQLAFKVNAYACVRVVDYCYRSKYFINSLSNGNREYHLSSYVKSLVMHCGTSDHQSLDKINDENMSVDLPDGHKVMFLDLPKNPDQQSTEIPSTEVHMQVDASHIQESGVENNQQTVAWDPCVSWPILPWINGDGSINTIVYKALNRRVMGIVMQNPGIMEDDIICRMDVLNPQSCRQLLELLVLDNHIIPRMMCQTTASPPTVLQSLLGPSFKRPEPVFLKHYFANPLSASLL